MQAPVYGWLAASAALLAQIPGNDNEGGGVRAYPFGEAPEGVRYPYVTWQTVSALPEQYLGQVPDIDYSRLQFDVWGGVGSQNGATRSEAVATIVRDILEQHGYMGTFSSTGPDPDTLSYGFRMEFEFWTPRG